MIEDTHRTKVLREMPEEKAAAKKDRTRKGVITAVFGVGLCAGSFYAFGELLANGVELNKWSMGFVILVFVSGMWMVSQGSHHASSELTTAAWKDMAATIRSLWRRNGNGGGS